MKKIIVIKAGGTFPHIIEKHGGFDQWVINGMDIDESLVEVVDVENGEELPELSEVLGAVMTGSHSMVTEKLPWSEKTAVWIRKAVDADLPFLGICYGHQLLAYALGGDAGYHPDGIEIGTVQVSLSENADNDPLFKEMPANFKAHVVHYQSALKLPEGAVVLASNSHEKYHAFRYKNAWGVQFHPEFNAEVMKEYVTEQAEKLSDADKKMCNVTETPEAESILKMFADYSISL